MPKRPCLGCGELTTGSYCPAHQPGLNPARGSGWAASRFREAVLAKTGGACARCGSRHRVQAHHIRPIVAGGHPTDPANGEALCGRCHAAARGVHL